MRIFLYELKKLWNWRIIILIAAMGVLTWFAFLGEVLRSYDSLTTHGIYGFYQTEMFGLYGETLEPEELAHYDILGKKASLISEMDEIISNEMVFAQNNISNYAQYKEFVEKSYSDNLTEEEEKVISDIISTMRSKLDYSNSAQSLDEWYASPLMRMQTLEALEHTYIDYKASLLQYIEHDSRPVVVRAAERLLEMHNKNLIRYDLCRSFSGYAAIVGIFTIVAVIILIAPLLITDRMWKINLMQYSSAIGRKIFKIQFAVIVVSALVLSILFIVVMYIIFLASGAGDYWNAPIMLLALRDMQLYNITFGQYVFILGGMILALSLGTACLVFILARFSENIVMMLIKAVPVGIAVAGITAISLNMALSENNIVFSTIFNGRFDAPEVMTCGLVAVVGLTVAAIVCIGEKRVDVA